MKFKGLFVLLSCLSIAVFFSCTKINESTELGDDLIPAVDNVNTFDTTLEVQAAFYPFEDSSKHLFGENMALGRITDPAFGTTTADLYFNLSSQTYGASPFKDTVTAIDSVVLSLSYTTAYGDTSAAAQIGVDVSEINLGNNFYDTLFYRYDNPGFSSGASLGSKTLVIQNLDDTVQISPSGRRTDSAKILNVARIRLNNSLGEKLRNFDAAAYANDSAFRTRFRGLAVKAITASMPGTLAYFNVSDFTKTGLIVYYRSSKNGIKDTTTATFVHNTFSQANSIKRTVGGEYSAKIGSSSSQKLYIQSSPTGSYIGMKVPGLDAFPNRVIHRAELIAYKVPADNPAFDNTLRVPNLLFLDHKGNADSAYFFERDITASFDGNFDYGSFGGRIRPDESYRFNITRYVQGIVTRKERNDSLRLYAPLRSYVYSPSSKLVLAYPFNNVLDYVAKGRAVIANNNFPDASKRLRLRIIYSNL